MDKVGKKIILNLSPVVQAESKSKKQTIRENQSKFNKISKQGGQCVNKNVSMRDLTTTTTTKPFVPSIWGRLHEPKENYAGSGTWISFLHSFLSGNMPSLRPLASISCRITSIHVFFGLPCALLICPKLIRFTSQTGASIGLRRT